jgi:hypothetical protein
LVASAPRLGFWHSAIGRSRVAEEHDEREHVRERKVQNT